MKMKKCFGKTHSVVQLLLILWMTSLIHIAVWDYSSAAYLQEGESYFISTPWTVVGNNYHLEWIQTHAANGFRVVFRYLYLDYGVVVKIGTGSDPSDIIQSVYGFINHAPDDVYVYTNVMRFLCVTETGGAHRLKLHIEIISIDLSNFFACSSSNMIVSPTVLCDGIYHCDHYEDELACNYPATYIEEGESHVISVPGPYTPQSYNTISLQTSAANVFRVVFQYLYLYGDDEVQIGTGNDPSDIQSVITTFHGYRDDIDDLYVGTNEMWFAVTGIKVYTRLEMHVEIISIDLSTVFTCSSTKKIMPSTVLCDGLYDCDHYEDELACSNAATYLQKGKSHFIYIPFSNTSRLYNTTFLQKNSTYGFRIVFQYLNLYYDDEVHVGTGNDPSDNQSVITTIHGYTNNAPDDVYVDTNEMWFAVIGAKFTSRLEVSVEIISIDLSMICQNTTWMSSRFGLIHFPEGENGAWANSTEVCPFNTENADQAIGLALCVGDLISQSTWLPDPTDNCGPFRNVGDILTQLSKVIVSDENVAKLSEEVSLVTSYINDISSDDISSIANIISNINARTNYSEKVVASIVAIVSNIAEVDTETLESSPYVMDVVKGFDQQIKRVPVEDGGNFSIRQENIAVQVQSVPTDVISNGLVLSLVRDTNIQTSDANRDEATKPENIAVVNIPSAISSAIPPISGGSSDTSRFVRVISNVFRTPALFNSKSSKNTNLGTNRSANTPVISLSIGDEKIEDLTEPIKFTFTPIEPGLTNPSCSYWDIGNGDWSQEGCQLLSASGIRSPNDNNLDPPSDEKIVCGCNHLTHFAVLMDSIEERSFEQAYTVLTYIGRCISIVSLLVTLATYLSNRVLREKQTNQIFICLCLTLPCLYVSFIAMMSLDSAKRQYQVKTVPCGIITALVHYFVLSSITWMGVEGYNTYLIIVKKFDTYISWFMAKAGTVAWGIPAVIVSVTGAIAQDKYAREDLCFPRLGAQIGGLLIPMTIIILFNVVIFALVVRELMKSSNVAVWVKREAKVERREGIKRRENIKRVQNAICILLLLGLTCITGNFLMIREFSQVVEPIFTVLNSCQGLFIFLLYCVRKPVIRKQWGLTCLDRVKRQDATTATTAATTLSTKPQENSIETFL